MRVFGGLKLHPNGFLGAPFEYRSPHASKPVTLDLVKAVTRNVSIENEDNLIKPNNFIMELYDEVIAKEDAMKRNLLFRERVYTAALQAFGTLTINEWIDRQKQNPYFDTMQNRFVEEMVCFVFTGFAKYHPASYINSFDIGERNALSIGPNVREYLLVNSNGQPMLIRDFVLRWLGQRDGMTNLLCSLRVLFGS